MQQEAVWKKRSDLKKCGRGLPNQIDGEKCSDLLDDGDDALLEPLDLAVDLGHPRLMHDARKVMLVRAERDQRSVPDVRSVADPLLVRRRERSEGRKVRLAVYETSKKAND